MLPTTPKTQAARRGVPMIQETSFVLIDRDRLFLEALPSNRDLLKGVRIVGRALDIPTGLDVVRRTAPDVVVIDGFGFQLGFRDLSNNVAIRLGQMQLCVFADHLTDAQLDLAIASGALGLLSRQSSLSEMARAIQEVGNGQHYIAESIRPRLVETSDPRRWEVAGRMHMRDLTDRQLEVLVHLAEGKRVKEIADLLSISEKAVESHKYRLMNRLGIHDRVELCRWAIREGLVEP